MTHARWWSPAALIPSRLLAWVATSLLACGASLCAQTPDCSSGLVQDDGTADGWLPLSSGRLFATPFTPSSYPYRIERVCVGLGQAIWPFATEFEVNVCADNGGQPGAVLATVRETHALPLFLTPGSPPAFFSFELRCNEPTISSGSFWVTVRSSSVSPVTNLMIDSGTDVTWQESSDGGGTWTPNTALPSSLMIRVASDLGPAPSAVALPYNGSGANPSWYQALPPGLGTTWSATVDTRNYVGNPTRSQIFFFAAPSGGTFLAAGEVLVNLASPLYLVSAVQAGWGVHAHTSVVPADPALVGAVVYTQAVIGGDNGFTALNGYELRVGCL